MKYEEIKIGDVFRYEVYEETVISKNDEHRIITTIDSEIIPTSWTEDELYLLKPIKEELPEEGLLVGKSGSLVYKLSDGSAYGFGLGKQSNYKFYKNQRVIFSGNWKPATNEEERKFVQMLKKECENRGLFEDTKLEENCINSTVGAVNKGVCGAVFTVNRAWNKNGKIFEKGKFATPRKETTIELVSKAVKGIADFTIEQTESGLIILTPMNHD